MNIYITGNTYGAFEKHDENTSVWYFDFVRQGLAPITKSKYCNFNATRMCSVIDGNTF